jgi:hypothetical protein
MTTIYIKTQANNSESIGLFSWVRLKQNGLYLPINKENNLVDHNMNARIDGINEIFTGATSIGAPYYTGSAAKAYYVFKFEIEDNFTLEFTDWANTTFGKPYSVFVSYDNINYELVANNNTNIGTGKIFSVNVTVIYGKLIVKDDLGYKSYSNGWIDLGSSYPTETVFMNQGVFQLKVVEIPFSAWGTLQGNVELHFYSSNPSRTTTSFNIETTPFTLFEEWEDQEIKIIEYTDNLTQTESTVSMRTEPFSLYSELGNSVDVLYYTDDPDKASANVEFTANYTPLDEIEGDFEVVTWSDTVVTAGNEPKLTYSALPFEQLIVPATDFKSYGSVKSLVAQKINQAQDGKLRFIVSFDSGTTWKTYIFNKWRVIDVGNFELICRKGMTIDILNAIPESDLSGINRIGYYLDNSIHNSSENIQLDYVKVISSAPINDVKFDNLAFYLLNTTATIQVSLQGNKIVGTLDDVDAGRVQYRVLLNNSPYYPSSGFSTLLSAPVNIQLNISDSNILFGQENVLRVEFQDYWGQTDYWETTFVGTYSGIMFKDESGHFYSTSIGEVLKHLDFEDIIAGQTTLEQKVIVKNQLGVQLQNLILEVQKDKLPEGVKIELSRSNFPFAPEDPLLFNMFFNVDEEFEFYTRIVTDIQAPAAPNGEFEVRAKADPV